MFLPGYGHVMRIANSLQWDASTLELSADAGSWPHLPSPLRDRVRLLVAGFCVGEARVAQELDPFAVAAATDEGVARCFRLQQRDEARHSRLFDRVAAEVMQVPGASATERRDHLRHALSPDFLDLFERRLAAVTSGLATGTESLERAVAVYHLLLEGVVFTAGQLALLELLDGVPLPGLRRGIELVLRDERWHIGFGARLLDDLAPDARSLDILLEEAGSALGAWGEAVPPSVRQRALAIHRRRLVAAGLAESRPRTQSLVAPGAGR